MAEKSTVPPALLVMAALPAVLLSKKAIELLLMIAALPAVQSRLADAALSREGIEQVQKMTTKELVELFGPMHESNEHS